MKITCANSDFGFAQIPSDLNIVLYGTAPTRRHGSVGATLNGAPLKSAIVRHKLVPAKRAWDLLSLALAAASADIAGHRSRSPDGWTRDFGLTVSVADAPFWNANAETVQQLLAFLSTDRWNVCFVGGETIPPASRQPTHPDNDCVVLLSGGLDSYVGAIDRVVDRRKPLSVSQMVRGDGEKQRSLTAAIGGGMRHFQFNHNIKIPKPESPASQRARSIVFLAYGVFMATTLSRYHSGDEAILYVCENGFISINPPLTGGRLGSLSTRTTHPVVFALLQQLLDAAGLRVKIVNPYHFKTKGEMLRECRNQELLREHAVQTTSCGRYKQFGYRHCGRCVPCLVRRAAFQAWGVPDLTRYVYKNLGLDDQENAGFDDVRSTLMGITEHHQVGTTRWLGAALSSGLIADKQELERMVGRGLRELQVFLNGLGVR